ncbi:GNAT family N-acetyltransferase [bacterium]|nr:GNAT family N-acetyltransferase [bacterium]
MRPDQELARLLDLWRDAADPDPELAPQLAAAASTARASDLGSDDLWRRFLETTGESAFLISLPDREARHAWADLVFWALRRSDFGLAALLDWRVRTRGEVTYLHDLGRPDEPALTYQQTAQRARGVAARLLGPGPLDRPRAPVALLSANTLDGIIVDLACLVHDIPVAPLNIQEDTATLAWICDRLAVADLVVDTPDRLQRALEIRDRVGRPFTIHLLSGHASDDERVRLLAHDLADLSAEEIGRRLAIRPRLGLDDTCTVLFTSGSTGRPKGIAFTPFNLVSKRFARAAALPAVGRDELLVAFLPLYHTFGRYLELMGMLYWGGTYALAGNPSADALFGGMQRLHPTGLISVPLRWQQIRERTEADPATALSDVTGGRLRWGLSAAGWLAPDTFRWFHGQGVELCSGFGMTEGTGGLTMTPPGEYREDSVGRPLPGVAVRIGEDGELQVAGPYVARYLPPDDEPGDLSTGDPAADDQWLGTGDLFETLPDGHLRIVDRIKDIYKNNRGQTVAPRKVESRFAGVPGIKSTFLAGDGRPYNVLLIVPDPDDPVIAGRSDAERDAYYHRVVSQANLDLAAYERVVNFAVLDREFSADEGELTPKGSLRRKQIAANFSDLLAQLYRRPTLTWRDRTLLIPDWVLRDLNVLEDELAVDGDAIVNRRTGARLEIDDGRRPGWLRLGDLEYRPLADERGLDLGQFARQPLLWVGNPSLQSFLPCRGGWDARFVGVDEQVLLPAREATSGRQICPPRRDDRLGEIDDLVQTALFGDLEPAREAVLAIEARLPKAPPREALLLRRRLEALAGHPELAIRCEAYRILVLDDPEPDYGRYLPAFVTSGRPFLCEDSIAAIAGGAREPRRLLSFRRRLHAYRRHLEWPATPEIRRIFADLLQLLVDFARHHPENVATVRRELICWQLFDRDPELADHAVAMRRALTDWHLQHLAESQRDVDWTDVLVFQEGLDDGEIASLRRVLEDTTFLAESVAVAFDARLDLSTVPQGGIWVSRTFSQPFPSRYRVSVNTETGRHFDLLVILRTDLDDPAVARTFNLVAAIRSWPAEAPVLPRLGALRGDLGAASLAFASGLTVWDHIRRHATTTADAAELGRGGWRRLMVAGMATVLTAWKHSGRKIVPGMVTPSNVSVPERDWQRGRLMISLAGWRDCTGPLDLVRPLLKNFLRLPDRHYPAVQGMLEDRWLLEAVSEALGQHDGAAFLDDVAAALEREPLPEAAPDLAVEVRRHAELLRERYVPNLAVEGATERFHTWRAENPDASARARGDQIEALIRLYRLDREGELGVLTLFRDTFLASAPEAAREACDRLLAKLFRHPELRAMRTVELSDLQDALESTEQREVLARLAFPRMAGTSRPAVQPIGDRAREHVVLQSEIQDDRGVVYTVREPRDAAEMGRLYRQFLRANFPLEFSEVDHHLVVVDTDEQLAGGVVWRLDASGEPHLDGVVITRSLQGRGLARNLLDDFTRRLADAGHEVLRTHFSLRGFFAGLGFTVDRQRGGLVKRLGP